MIAELCIEASALGDLKKLLESDVEKCAVLLATRARRASGKIRLLVREVILPAPDDYRQQSSIQAELSPLFVATVSKQAKLRSCSLIFVHTHPGSLPAEFSSVDDQGERLLKDFLDLRGVVGPHAALLLSQRGLRCRALGQGDEVRVVSLGVKRSVEFDPCEPAHLGESVDRPADLFDRQVRAFGADGQRRLESLKVAIIGLGGTGSIAAQQLVHLGIKDFVLIDPDTIEATNLNRVVGATIQDIGSAKSAVAKRYLEAFRPGIAVRDVYGNVVHDRVARELCEADLIFCCTDSHGSRAVIQQVAYQYMIPCFDMGSTITQASGRITGIFGRVQCLSPGFACLWCSQLLDPAQVRRDMANEVERKLDPYIVDGGEPAPSVISLNSTVVSLAVSMVLGFVTDAPLDSRHLIYNALNSTLRTVKTAPNPSCFICSKAGALEWGDTRPLFTRQD